MSTRAVQAVGVLIAAVLCRAPAAAEECSPDKLAEVRAPAARWDNVKIDCDLTLSSTDVITKFLHFEGHEASGTILECNGATINGGPGSPNDNARTAQQIIQVMSKVEKNASGTDCKRDASGRCLWLRPQNVTIRGCNVMGRIGIRGWSMELDSEGLKSSRLPDHATFARSIAPKYVALDDLTITTSRNADGTYPEAVYLFPGTSRVTLSNSRFYGTAALAVYLDAETEGNVIRDNSFGAAMSREIIAVDGSENNWILRNKFFNTSTGGIFFYRNCGERGGIRHTTPSNNVVINNIFLTHPTHGSVICVGSRNGLTYKSWCNDDMGFPFGSSASNLDHAENNAIMDNQFQALDVNTAIRIGAPDSTDRNNIVSYNTTVPAGTPLEFKPTGCYLPTGFTRSFIWHGGSVDVIQDPGGACVRKRCTDGLLSDIATCSTQQVDFDCQAVNTNAGCDKVIACPAGTTAVGVTAACNLESSWVNPSHLSLIPSGRIAVLTPSDNPMDGLCFAGYSGVSTGETTVRGTRDLTAIWVGCREKDSNGGDCQIRGKLYCE